VGAVARAQITPDEGSAAAFGPDAAAERAARELLALQASDWAFMVSRRLTGDYPHGRVRNHAAAFARALALFDPSVTDWGRMSSREHLEHGPESASEAARGDGSVAALRGLAPLLELSTLLEPSSSSWARQLDVEGR
jgi:hypothetical protein